MRILSQSKEEVLNMPRSMWLTEVGGRGYIMSNAMYNPVIGDYATKERASQVLNSLYSAFKGGAKVYEMPVK